ncbi:pantoate--beta-alanine ligase [Stygiobacter electus]|uniref:Pantothenate synthetase n=1 Tax=Stygiobacter electus TaxID=3032292 RepID=A0AAE3P476_9BACT|nr:pantoate--beta-alanine ligase [Stygiobacter electus]MDF1612595.1 pantoate--beta-alanine ligase [Stygiobacter electus]
MTKVIKKISEWKKIRNSEELKNKTVGFVPTMGAFHQGHASLIERCLIENNISVVSIFVNPTQFNDPNDLRNYPRTLDSDLKLLEKMNVDYLLYPEYEEIYSDNYRYKIIETDFSKKLCGAFRPKHFEGVLTIVLKLFNIVKPHKAYFGEKDYQQLKLIEGMCKAFFMDIEIVPCPIVRDEDGLALSSRNLLLTNEERKIAVNFPKLLKARMPNELIKEELEKLGFKVDYIENLEGRRFGAVHIGKVRLIDNVEL